MTPDVEHQAILLKDLYSLLENIDSNLQDIVNKNKISIQELKIVSEKNVLRLLLYTTDGRVITQMLSKKPIISSPPCKLSYAPLV